MQGTSGSYAINGTALTLQPSFANWVARAEVGVDGFNRPVYPAIREYEIGWELISTTDLKQIIDAGLSVSNTGTLVWDLPKWGDADYTYYSYSGTIMREPEVGNYFVGYVMDVRIVIGNVRTA